MLNRDQILEANDLKTDVVDVPEWGGSVKVRTMTGAERDAFEASLVTVDAKGSRKSDLTNMRAKLVVQTAVDDNGCRLFEAGDLDALARKSAAALDRVFQAAQKLNGMGVAAEDEAVKNSSAAPSGDSPSV